MMAFAARIKELEGEAADLRSRVDARYTASVLLGLGGSSSNGDSGSVEIKSSTAVCGSGPVTMMGPDGVFAQALADNQLNETVRRVRRRGKYTPQEREMIRRERNRIHAKKTRDKKKVFLEASEIMIRKLEDNVYALRDYLVKCNLLSTKELQTMLERDRRAQIELASVKDPLRTGTNALVDLSSSWDDSVDAEINSKRHEAGNNMMQALFTEVDAQAGYDDDNATDDENKDVEYAEDAVMKGEEESSPDLAKLPRRSSGLPLPSSTDEAPAVLSSSSSSSSISDMANTTNSSSSYTSGETDSVGGTSSMTRATSMQSLSMTGAGASSKLIGIGMGVGAGTGGDLGNSEGKWSTWSMGGVPVDSSEAVTSRLGQRTVRRA